MIAGDGELYKKVKKGGIILLKIYLEDPLRVWDAYHYDCFDIYDFYYNDNSTWSYNPIDRRLNDDDIKCPPIIESSWE